MIGLVCDLVFFRVPDRPHIRGLNWRLMLASVRIRILRCALLITGQIRLAYPPSSFLFKCCSVPSLRDGMYPKDVTTRPFSPCCGYAIIPSKPLAIFIVCAATNIIVDKLMVTQICTFCWKQKNRYRETRCYSSNCSRSRGIVAQP